MTGMFSPAGLLAEARVNYTATLLPDGGVLDMPRMAALIECP